MSCYVTLSDFVLRYVALHYVALCHAVFGCVCYFVS